MSIVPNDLNQLWLDYQLKVTDEIAKSPEVLFCNGSAIGTLGNFSASTGKAKSKKTFNVSAILAASLTNGEILRYIIYPIIETDDIFEEGIINSPQDMQ